MAEPLKKIDMDNGNFPYATDIGKVLAKTNLHNSHRAILDAIFNKTFAWYEEDSLKQQKHKKRKTKAIISFKYFEEFTGLRPGKISFLLKQLTDRKIIIREKIGREHSYSFNVNVSQWDRQIFRNKFQVEGWGIVTLSGNLFDPKKDKKEETVGEEEKAPEIVTSSDNHSKEPIVTSSGKSGLPEVVSDVTSSGNHFSPLNDVQSAGGGMSNINSSNKPFKLKKIVKSQPSENPTTKKELTPIQKIVEFYKKLKGFDKDPTWDRKYFARCSKTAAKLLKDALDDEELVMRGIKEIGTGLDKVPLTWQLETIYQSTSGVKHFENFLKKNPPKKKVENKSKEPEKPVKLAADMTDEQREKSKLETAEKLRKMGINPAFLFKKKRDARICSDLVSIRQILAVN